MLNDSNQLISGETSCLKSILALVILVGLTIIHISSKHYTTGILSNVYSAFCVMTNFRHTLHTQIMNE